MRLINIHTLKLRTFGPEEVPLYGILSHRWGPEEISYEEFSRHRNRRGAGYEKVKSLCRKVADSYWTFEREDTDGRIRVYKRQAVDWVWIDTCCFDKRDLTEYSEAINSMWKWYKQAAFCVVYLADVSSHRHRHHTLADLRASEWFTRGWTLQELLAPRSLFFYSKDWRKIGSSLHTDLMDSVALASSIPREYLGSRKASLSSACVARRMSWASRRRTTKEEDIAYCLIGIFDVSMSLIHGEGAEKAFQRLQEQILNRSDDESIFAFKPRSGQDGILATSPRDFADSGNIIEWKTQSRNAYYVTNRGLRFKSSAMDVTHDFSSDKPRRQYAIQLNCRREVPGAIRPKVCSLGLKKKGSRYIRDPEIERRFEATSQERGERKLDRGTWKWASSRRFYIHTSSPGKSRSRHKINYEEGESPDDLFTMARKWVKRNIFGVPQQHGRHSENRREHRNRSRRRHKSRARGGSLSRDHDKKHTESHRNSRPRKSRSTKIYGKEQRKHSPRRRESSQRDDERRDSQQHAFFWIPGLGDCSSPIAFQSSERAARRTLNRLIEERGQRDEYYLRSRHRSQKPAYHSDSGYDSGS